MAGGRRGGVGVGLGVAAGVNEAHAEHHLVGAPYVEVAVYEVHPVWQAGDFGHHGVDDERRAALVFRYVEVHVNQLRRHPGRKAALPALAVGEVCARRGHEERPEVGLYVSGVWVVVPPVGYGSAQVRVVLWVGTVLYVEVAHGHAVRAGKELFHVGVYIFGGIHVESEEAVCAYGQPELREFFAARSIPAFAWCLPLAAGCFLFAAGCFLFTAGSGLAAIGGVLASAGSHFLAIAAGGLALAVALSWRNGNCRQLSHDEPPAARGSAHVHGADAAVHHPVGHYYHRVGRAFHAAEVKRIGHLGRMRVYGVAAEVYIHRARSHGHGRERGGRHPQNVVI